MFVEVEGLGHAVYGIWGFRTQVARSAAFGSCSAAACEEFAGKLLGL